MFFKNWRNLKWDQIKKVEKVQETLNKNKVMYEGLKKTINSELIKPAYDNINI